MILSFDEVGDLLDEMAEQFPEEFYQRLNGGISLLPSGQPATPLSEWFARGVAKVCLYVDSEEALLAVDRRAKEAGLISALICDNGITEFHGKPTYTCLAFEPALPETVDPITGELPLF